MKVLRFTTEPQKDLENNASYHYTDFRVGSIDWIENQTEIEYVAEKLGCDVDEVKIIDGYYVQELPGLCGYELYEDDLEDAIEEAREYIKESNYSGDNYLVIYEGEYTDQEFAIDGILFEAFEILHQEKI